MFPLGASPPEAWFLTRRPLRVLEPSLFDSRQRIRTSLFPNSCSRQVVIKLEETRSILRRFLLDNSTANNTLLDFLRKEVIQPHLPIRLPCYDFTPVIEPAFDSSFLSVRSLASGIPNSHGVTGGVYKTRERIHRDILIRDY